ncbi:hypothetical protein C8Q73DRAFT_674968 [Cubamyces lactineus]|nr:hypothetical protein C8Q73DRAFT_674968 [Cubamyces lactineus]
MYHASRTVASPAFELVFCLRPRRIRSCCMRGIFAACAKLGETNLNLDMINLAAYPPSRKLQSQLVQSPQEVILAMDQVLKDLTLELGEEISRRTERACEAPKARKESRKLWVRFTMSSPSAFPPSTS